MKVTFIFRILLFTFLVIGWNCTERNRTNPFDPGGNSSSPVALSLTPGQKSVQLRWSVKEIIDYTGFRVYRSLDPSGNFQLLAQLPPNDTEFADSTLQVSRWYYYRVTVLGNNVESRPSPVQKALLGPGNVWILTRYGYSIQEYSYDLQNRINLYNTNFPPVDWAPDLLDNYFWMAFSQYRIVSRLNLDLGYEDFFLENNLVLPVDVEWDSLQHQLYVLDQGSDKYYILKDKAVVDSVSLSGEGPFKMLITDHSNLWVLDTTGVSAFDAKGDSLVRIPFPEGYKGEDLCSENGVTYILASNSGTGSTCITICDGIQPRTQGLDLGGHYTMIRKPAYGSYFWMVEQTAQNSYRPVKLSSTGERLLELPPVFSIEDLQVNPYDHSIVIARRYEETVASFDSLGNPLAELSGIYDPIKVFIH